MQIVYSHADPWEISVFTVLDNGRQTTCLICQLVFQVWVWLTENNEGGKKSISRSKKLPFVPKGNEIETKTGLCYRGSSSLLITSQIWSRRGAQPCSKPMPNAAASTACVSEESREGSACEQPQRGDSLAGAGHGGWAGHQAAAQRVTGAGGRRGADCQGGNPCLRHGQQKLTPCDVRFTELSTQGPANAAWQ